MSLLKHYWKSILTGCVIFYLSILRMPSLQQIPKFPLQDKLVHFIMYFTLAFFLYKDYTKLKLRSKLNIVLLVIVFPSLYGGIIELLQGNFFPPRTAEWGDFLADVLGALLAFILLHYFVNSKINKR